MDELDTLVDAARAGGSWAFGRLWEQLAPPVHAYLRGRGARDAEDATSEVFLAAFGGVTGFDGDGRAFRSWVFTIAHHKGVDAVRRSVAAREVPTDSLDDGRLHQSAEDDALARLGDETVHELLATLSVDQRSVLLLRIVADLSLEETAAVLAKPVGAVKSLQHRALAALRRTLDQPAPVSRDAAATIALPR